MSKSEEYLQQVFKELDLLECEAAEKYAALPEIVAYLSYFNAEEKKKNKSGKGIDGSITGYISEKLCRMGIPDDLMEQSRPLGRQWSWLGDMILLGHPFDVIVSIKSFKARERLLASGSGSLLAPTIGWGLFDAPEEWEANRAAAYLYRGFVAIYMPVKTLERLSSEARNVRNINGKILLRDLLDFPSDLEKTKISNGSAKGRLDVKKL